MRKPVIDPQRERDLFAYILGISNKLNCKLIRINAALNHIHLLVKFPTTLSAADYIASVKRASSFHIKEKEMFPGFEGWSKEYSVQTVSPSGVEAVTTYIANQKEHHKVFSFEQEWLINLPEEERSSWKMDYFDH